MPYLGSTPNASFSTRTKQDFTANGSTTAFTLSSAVASANDIEVFVGNVRQEPTDAYTVNGTTLTMSAAPANGLNFYVVFKGLEENSVVPADNTISTAKIASGAVTDAKIAGMAASKLTGALPALDGSALTNVTTGVVAFHARYIDGSVGTLANANYVIFQGVDTNEGSGYDNTDGIFTVPAGKGGTYYFYSRLLYDKNSASDTDSNYTVLEFHKNNTLVGGHNISHYYGRGDYDYTDGTMCVNMAAGDTMRIYHSGNATLYGGSYSSFNGFRIG